MLSWVFRPENSVAVGGWGLIVAVVGLALSMTGFGLGAWQILKTRSAAEAARDAAKSAKSQLRIYDIIFELSEIAAELREAIDHIQSASWDSAVRSVFGAHKSVVRVSELANLTPDQVSVLHDAGTALLTARKKIRTVRAKGPERFDPNRAEVDIEQAAVNIARISAQIERFL